MRGKVPRIVQLPISVQLDRNPCSRSPESVFMMAGIGVHHARNRCSASVGISVHVRPESAFTMGRNPQSPEQVFVSAAITLLVIVVVGFAPTLFLRPLFDVPPRPLYLYFHGAVLSGWFVWLVVKQGWCRRAAPAHTVEQDGWGAGFGAMVVVASLMATLGLIPNLRSEGANLDDPLPFVVNRVGWLAVLLVD